MPKAPKTISKARQARKDRRKGTTAEEGPVNDILGRRIATAIYDDATQRNKETATLAEVLRCRLPKRGGVTKERAVEMQQLFKKGKCLPVTSAEQAVEKQLREAAMAELVEARVRIEEARAEALAFDEEKILTGMPALSTEDKNKEPELPNPFGEPTEASDRATRQSTPALAPFLPINRWLDLDREYDLRMPVWPSNRKSSRKLPCGCPAACESTLAVDEGNPLRACHCRNYKVKRGGEKKDPWELD